MSIRSTKQQISLCIIPPVYEALGEITNRLKNISTRLWTNSAVMNSMVEDLKELYLNLSPNEANERFKKYIALRGTKKNATSDN
jgi:hypothetical protein